MIAPPERHPSRGFTLIEVMIVLTIIAVTVALVSFTLRDGAQNRLELEAARLAALLEGARAESRALGLPVRWQPVSDDNAPPGTPQFRFVGLPTTSDTPTRWMHDGVTAEVVGSGALVLGPEPLIGAQRVVLHLDEHRAVVATDGLGPFALVVEDAP
jgi:general secretion pathway protein H